MGKWFEELAAVFYPQQCPVCKEILPVSPGAGVWIHRGCLKKLSRVREPVCKKCGKPLTDAQKEYCADCLRSQHRFEYGRSLWRYDRFSAQVVFSYKYGRRQDLAGGLARIAAAEAGSWIRSLHVGRLVPVPISRSRMRRRGFNQAQLFAEQLGDLLRIPVTDGLRRRHETKPQKELGRRERKQNLASAFYVRPGSFDGVKRVLLIDDIYTTGSTADACAGALRDAGVEKVWVFTLCIGEYEGPDIKLLDERPQGVI